MKWAAKFLVLISAFQLFSFQLFPQGNPNPSAGAASQAEVNAGTLRSKYVSPFTMNNSGQLLGITQYIAAVAALNQGGATSGIPKLNGFGTNTTLITPTLNGTINSVGNITAFGGYLLVGQSMDVDGGITIGGGLSLEPITTNALPFFATNSGGTFQHVVVQPLESIRLNAAGTTFEAYTATNVVLVAGTNVALVTNNAAGVRTYTVHGTGGGGDVSQSGQNNFTGSNSFAGFTRFKDDVYFDSNDQIADTLKNQAFDPNLRTIIRSVAAGGGVFVDAENSSLYDQDGEVILNATKNGGEESVILSVGNHALITLTNNDSLAQPLTQRIQFNDFRKPSPDPASPLVGPYYYFVHDTNGMLYSQAASGQSLSLDGNDASPAYYITGTNGGAPGNAGDFKLKSGSVETLTVGTLNGGLAQVTAAIETNSSTFEFSDGTKVAKSNIVVFVGGDSRTQTNQNVYATSPNGLTNMWHVQLTNSPGWRGIKALVSVTTGGGLGFASVTNGWQNVGLPWYSNNWAPGMVGIFMDASGRNDQIDPHEIQAAVTNDAAAYFAAKTNFYLTKIKPLGIKVASATIDATAGYSGAKGSSEASAQGRFMFNTKVINETNAIDFVLDFWRATPNNNDPNIYVDGVHVLGLGAYLWMLEADDSIRHRRKRIPVTGLVNEGGSLYYRDSATGVLISNLKTNKTFDNVWAYGGVEFYAPAAFTPGFFMAPASGASALVAQGQTNQAAGTAIFQVLNSSGGVLFQVFPDGHALGSASTLYAAPFTVYSGGNPSLEIINTGTNDWSVMARDNGKFVVRDTTAGVDRISIDSSGNFKFGVDASGPTSQRIQVANNVNLSADVAGAVTYWEDSLGQGTGGSGGHVWRTGGPRASGTAQTVHTNQMTLSPLGTLSVANGFFTSGVTITNGNIFVTNDVSALTFTDRSHAPESLKDAWEIVNSMKSKNGRVDHDALSPKAWGTRTRQLPTGKTNTVTRTVDGKRVSERVPEIKTVVEPDKTGRDLGMVVSAQAMVIQDLQKRLEKLEKKK